MQVIARCVASSELEEQQKQIDEKKQDKKEELDYLQLQKLC